MQSAKQAVNAPSSSRSRTNRETSRVDLSWVRRKRCGSHASLPEKTAIENVYLMTQIAEGGLAATVHWNAESLPCGPRKTLKNEKMHFNAAWKHESEYAAQQMIGEMYMNHGTTEESNAIIGDTAKNRS